MIQVESKLNKLVEKLDGGREDHLAEIEAMRRVFKDATLKQALAKNPAMEKLLGMLKKRESSFTSILANKEDLTQEQRNSFFNRRKEVRFFLTFFESADKTIDSLEKELDYQLSDEVLEEETE